jgi:hypothetical protein
VEIAQLRHQLAVAGPFLCRERAWNKRFIEASISVTFNWLSWQ